MKINENKLVYPKIASTFILSNGAEKDRKKKEKKEPKNAPKKERSQRLPR
jgi:hypothetical protein